MDRPAKVTIGAPKINVTVQGDDLTATVRAVEFALDRYRNAMGTARSPRS